jgi:hypothetical protein
MLADAPLLAQLDPQRLREHEVRRVVAMEVADLLAPDPGCGCLSLDRCRFTNPDDGVASLGPGPRFWVGDGNGR